MTARHLPAFGLFVVVCAAACGDSTPSRPAPPAAPAGETAAVKAPPPPPPIRALMREHFAKATEARAAFIAGDMETAVSAMDWLATNEVGQETVPAALRPNLAGVRAEAGRFALAATFSQAGDAFGAMLTRCGDCHSQAGMAPSFTDVPEPVGTELKDRMRKHAWAAEQLWEGLVARDQGRYDRAAHALADVVVQAAELPPNTNDPVRVQAVADNVRTAAAAGLAATDWPARAQDYGKFLATCATCHRMMAVGDKVRAGLQDLPLGQPIPPPQP